MVERDAEHVILLLLYGGVLCQERGRGGGCWSKLRTFSIHIENGIISDKLVQYVSVRVQLYRYISPPSKVVGVHPDRGLSSNSQGSHRDMDRAASVPNRTLQTGAEKEGARHPESRQPRSRHHLRHPHSLPL